MVTLAAPQLEPRVVVEDVVSEPRPASGAQLLEADASGRGPRTYGAGVDRCRRSMARQRRRPLLISASSDPTAKLRVGWRMWKGRGGAASSPDSDAVKRPAMSSRRVELRRRRSDPDLIDGERPTRTGPSRHVSTDGSDSGSIGPARTDNVGKVHGGRIGDIDGDGMRRRGRHRNQMAPSYQFGVLRTPGRRSTFEARSSSADRSATADALVIASAATASSISWRSASELRRCSSVSAA